MKNLFTALFIILTLNTAFGQDYYYYKGTKIDLMPRADKIALVLNQNNYSEIEIRSNLTSVISSDKIISKISDEVVLISFSENLIPVEIDNLVNTIKSQSSIVKIAAKVYYGTSRKVSQIVTDRIMVRLRNAEDIEKMKIFNAVNNCYAVDNFRDEKGFIIKSNPGVNKNALELSDIYYSSGIFEFAEPDFIYPEKCLLLSVPNDPYFPKQWSLINSGQLLQTGSSFLTYGDASTVNGIPGADMNVVPAWDFTIGSSNVKIGVIDTGIDSLHPDLQAAGHLLPGYDAFYNLNTSAVDRGNHGTSTAGLIGAVMNNSAGISGVAPGSKLMSIAIFDADGNTTSSAIARAFDTATARGIDILSNSWGGGTPEAVITDAINNAAINGRNGLGCVILFASGNDGNDPPLYPSVLPNVLSVGASTPHDQAKSPGTGNQFFWGSNYGENQIGDLDMVAPTNCYTLASGGGYEQNFWGTSATCPNAAGVAALVLSVNNSQTRLQVYENLLRGCDKIDNVPYQVSKSFGKWCDYYGYGRVNAYNSVRLAAGQDVTPPTINHLNIKSTSNTNAALINAEIMDQNGSAVPQSGVNQPKIFFKIKKGAGSWTEFDSACAVSVSGNNFSFKIPSQGWETEVQYYIRAKDASGNTSTFPHHAPNPFWLCYFTVGNITCESRKVSAFTGADFGATLSYPVIFGSFKILDTKVVIHMRHTYLDDELIQIFSPSADANNNRKCLFASNGGSMDNIYEAAVSDSASLFWKDGTPPYLNGHFKPEYNLRGLNGLNAAGNWRILHFDRSLTDYAFFDSVKIILSRTTGAFSSSVRLNNPSDSILNFDTLAYPDTGERNFYVKNSGTSNLNIYGTTFTGTYASMFSLVNTPSTVILPNDSSLFKIKLNTTLAVSAGDFTSAENAVFNIQTNDPSKPVFRVSLQTNDPLHNIPRTLQLKVFIEGLFNPVTGTVIPDTLKVYLRKSAAPYQVKDSSAAIFSSNGAGTFSFLNSYNDTGYYLIVKYRNGIETWSSHSLKFNNNSMNYDFTDSSSKAFGNNTIKIGGKYCIYSGDVNSDGSIDGDDMSMVDNTANSSGTGYLKEDLNADNIVDATDVRLADNNSLNIITVISP